MSKKLNLVGYILSSMEEICYVPIPIFKHKQRVAPQWAICLYVFNQMQQVMHI